MADRTAQKRHLKPGRGSPDRKKGGRPKGSRSKSTLFMEALLQGEAEGIIRKTIEMALAGDVQCLRMCMDRLIPPKKQVEVTGEGGGPLVVQIIDRFGNGDSDTP